MDASKLTTVLHHHFLSPSLAQMENLEKTMAQQITLLKNSGSISGDIAHRYRLGRFIAYRNLAQIQKDILYNKYPQLIKIASLALIYFSAKSLCGLVITRKVEAHPFCSAFLYDVATFAAIFTLLGMTLSSIEAQHRRYQKLAGAEIAFYEKLTKTIESISHSQGAPRRHSLH